MAPRFGIETPLFYRLPVGAAFARPDVGGAMQQARARGISLWLMPADPARSRIATLIDDLAARLGTRPFPPHLTLLSGVEGRGDDSVLATARSLAARLRPLTIRLESVVGQEEHFRCVIALAVADGPLRAAHETSALAFGRRPDPAFLPHVSLVYGSLAPETKRALILEAAPAARLAFEAARLHVWGTEGPVESWREIGAFELGPGRGS